MKEMFFTTEIPIYVILIFVLAMALIYIETQYDAKGVLAIIGGIIAILGIALCFVMAVPVIQTVAILIIFTIIITMFLLFKKHKEAK